MVYVRTVKTASEATAVQVVWLSSRLVPQHRACRLGARRAGVAGVESCRVGAVGGVADRTGLRTGRGSRLGTGGDHVVTDELPLGGLCTAYEALTFDSVTQGDTVFRDLVVARIIEPTSKADWFRVLQEVGVGTPSYATVKRRPPMYAVSSWGASCWPRRALPCGVGRRRWQT